MAIGNRQCLIVGLGNPGEQYAWTRHNLGFLLIDKLSSDAGIAVKRRECQSLVGTGEIEGRAVKLVKPQTYMNLTGEAVACLFAKHKLTEPGDSLVVITDDLALPFGKIRIRARGSAGGHNGLKTIISSLGTNEFTRLRIGIQPEHPVENSKQFVLDRFTKSARTEVEKVLEAGAGAVRLIVSEGVLKAMSRVNGQ